MLASTRPHSPVIDTGYKDLVVRDYETRHQHALLSVVLTVGIPTQRYLAFLILKISGSRYHFDQTFLPKVSSSASTLSRASAGSIF